MAQQQPNRGSNQRDDDAGMAQNRPAEELTGDAPGRQLDPQGQGPGGDLGAESMGGVGRTAGMGDMESGQAGGAIGSPGRTSALGEDELGQSGAAEDLAPGEDALGMGGTSDAGVSGIDAEGLDALEDDEDIDRDLLDESDLNEDEG